MNHFPLPWKIQSFIVMSKQSFPQETEDHLIEKIHKTIHTEKRSELSKVPHNKGVKSNGSCIARRSDHWFFEYF